MANMTMADWQTLSERINRVAPSATLAVDSKAKAMKAEGIDVIGFGAGEPNFPTPAAIVAAAAEAVQDPKNYRYTPTAGLPELRKAIADKTLRDSGYGVDPNQVIVTNGGKAGRIRILSKSCSMMATKSSFRRRIGRAIRKP